MAQYIVANHSTAHVLNGIHLHLIAMMGYDKGASDLVVTKLLNLLYLCNLYFIELCRSVMSPVWCRLLIPGLV